MSGRSRHDALSLSKSSRQMMGESEGTKLGQDDSAYLLPGYESSDGDLRSSSGPGATSKASKHSILPASSYHSLPSPLEFRPSRSKQYIDRLPNYALLIFLYFLQGIPLGLVHGTIPYLLKSKRGNDLTFTDLGLFSLAAYPYSLKLLWSPLVDSIFWPRLGRRKTWIIPAQLLIGIIFILIGYNVEEWIVHADADIREITFAFTLLILCCATQDIAVDGWALTLLDPEQVQYSSTCQTIGLNSGYFTAFTIFLALNSTDFCNHYLRSSPQPGGILEIAPFLKFWGVISIAATLFVAMFKREARVLSEFVPGTVIGAYQTIVRILRLPNIRSLALILLAARIGFTALDVIVPLKLIEKGYPKEKIALTVLIDFPCQLAVGFFAPYLSQRGRPLWGWHRAILLKLIMAFISMLVLSGIPADGKASSSYFLTILIMTVCSSFASTLMFVTMSAFFSIISDPAIGGTYLTLLNTMSNLGGMLPKFLIMFAVDWFTVKTCADHVCILHHDGFYIVNTVCIVVGGLLTFKFIIPTAQRLEIMVRNQWQINNATPHLVRADEAASIEGYSY